MEKATFKFDIKDLKIDSSQIEKILGFLEGEDRGLVTGLIDEILRELSDIPGIRAEYLIFNDIEFIVKEKSLRINNICFDIKKTVFGQMKKSDSVAVFLCTAGGEIGNRSRKAMEERDYLKGYIYDLVGSVVADASADLMQADLEKTVNAYGKKITNRYSPGYCGWDVAEQHKLFKLVPDNFCNIHLTDSALMDPVKSVSGFIGIGENVKFNLYTCNLCSMKDCAYRNIKVKV
jgi:hypothetical protein